MITISRLTVALVVTCFFSLGAIAARPAKMPKKMPASVPSELFFTMKGQPYPMERTFPGITAALMLSEEQKAALSEAAQETVANPELRQKRAALKGKNGTTEEERAAAQKQLEEARAVLSQRVAAILTAEQKALIEKIQEAAMEAQLDARRTFQVELAGAKGDQARMQDLREKMRVEAEDLLVQKLEKIMTPEQMQAIAKAATEQREIQEKERKRKLERKGDL